jgi:F0F1-type ATP synthase membrane subunit c/vacuolar-type H+-ATPase subunit K
MKNIHSLVGRSFVAIAAVGLAACNMDVVNPSVIDAAHFDPSGDAATLSLSAQSNFYKAYTGSVFWSAFFSGEAIPGVVRQETNDVGRRVATSSTSDVGNAWGILQRSLATNDLAVQALVKGPNAASDINLARAYMNAGFSLVLIAETYCQGDILVGPPLTPAQMMDSAIVRFKQALSVGAAAAAAGVAEGTKVVNASNAGIARASLQKKDYATAITFAALVPATFVYNAVTVDDASNRALGNSTYAFDIGSNSIVVPDAYRALNDPRVPWKDALKKAQDTGLEYYQQLKYTGYSSPIRVASGLEASYIAAEAQLQSGNSAAALSLITTRRAANGQPAFTGTTSAAILAELMDQRAREFWLEMKHLGDWQRNPSATPYVGAAGAPYFKPVQGTFGTATCLPVPISEITANPNFPKT